MTDFNDAWDTLIQRLNNAGIRHSVETEKSCVFIYRADGFSTILAGTKVENGVRTERFFTVVPAVKSRKSKQVSYYRRENGTYDFEGMINRAVGYALEEAELKRERIKNPLTKDAHPAVMLHALPTVLPAHIIGDTAYIKTKHFKINIMAMPPLNRFQITIHPNAEFPNHYDTNMLLRFIDEWEARVEHDNSIMEDTDEDQSEG